MKVSRAQAETNRRRIIDVAGRLFRERGFDGIGVADLMKAAGLTHGGFYGHFKSKEDLAVQACSGALATNIKALSKVVDGATGDRFAEFIAFYLSDDHKNATGRGCTLAALGPDVARHGGALRSAFAEGVAAYLAILTDIVPGDSQAEKRQKAMATLCSIVGALILSRAIDNEEFADSFLAAAAADATATAD